MCGLVGIFGKALSITQERIFKDLLYLDVFRGEHSTGAAVVSVPFVAGNPESVELFKEVGPAYNLFQTQGKFQGKYGLSSKTGIKLLLGHNRHATQGAVSAENAHPFELGNVVGAHNGTVLKSSLMKFHEADKYDVDSKIIYSHLGAGNSINSVWEAADGAMALTWYDKIDKKLKMIRNKERPLWVAKSKDGKTIYWASEAWMIWIATSRNGVKDIEEPVSLATDTLVEYDIDAQGSVVSEETAIPPFVPKPVVYSSGYKNGMNPWTGEFDEYSSYSKNQVPSKKPLLKIVIKEIAPNDYIPYAMGETEDGEEIKITFAKHNAKQCINNVLQRGMNKGVYVTDRYFRVYSQAPNSGMLSCTYSDLVFYKKNGLTTGFQGRALTSEEYTKIVKCGCVNCQVVPSWKSRDELKWIDQELFLCWSCKELSWVKDLENNYAM